MTNLVGYEKDEERYTFIFDGNSQVLDHILVSPGLLDDVVGADILHFNASYPDVLSSDATTPLRSSDHDALEARFRVDRVPAGAGPEGRRSQSLAPEAEPSENMDETPDFYLPLLKR